MSVICSIIKKFNLKTEHLKTWPLLFSKSYYQFYYAQDVSTFSLRLYYLPQLRKYIFMTLLF